MTLRQITLGVHHRGCWGSESTIPFPDISLKEVGPIDVQHKTDHIQLTAIWDVTFKSKQSFTDYLESLKDYDMLKEVRVIKFTDTGALLRTTWVKGDSSYTTVFANKALFTSPVTQEQGYEKYTLITEEGELIKELLAHLSTIGDVKIFSVGDADAQHGRKELTSKQMEAMLAAMDSGYYEWPRKVNLNELAKKLGVKRRTLQEHLRRAESKVFKHACQDMIRKVNADV